jgi:hypothetical protein
MFVPFRKQLHRTTAQAAVDTGAARVDWILANATGAKIAPIFIMLRRVRCVPEFEFSNPIVIALPSHLAIPDRYTLLPGLSLRNKFAPVRICAHWPAPARSRRALPSLKAVIFYWCGAEGAAITTFSTDDEAVALANNSECGLSAGVFSADVGRAIAIGNRLNTGLLHINDQSRRRTARSVRGKRRVG